MLDREIRDILALGVELRCKTRVGTDICLDDLERDFDAIFVAVGAQESTLLGISGEDACGCSGAVEFLRAHHLGQDVRPGTKVAVIGGGNSALDAAGTALRLGAEVTVYYRRDRRDMPAVEAEIVAAEAEGVRFEFSRAHRVLREGVAVSGLELVRMELAEEDDSGRKTPRPIPGSEFQVVADTVISAIGQGSDLDFLDGRSGGAGTGVASDRRAIEVDRHLKNPSPKIWAGGDVVTGPSTVVGSMAHGRVAAGKIIEYLTERPSPFAVLPLGVRGVGDYTTISEDLPQQPRQEMPLRQPKVRRRDFEEVGLGLTVDQAVAEARRCLQCSACSECGSCEIVCSDIGAIDHFRASRRIELVSPAVIVADEKEMPEGDYSDFPGLVRVAEFKGDLVTMMIAGSAAAGQAIALAAPLRSRAVPEPARILESVRRDPFGHIPLHVQRNNGLAVHSRPDIGNGDQRAGSGPWGDGLLRVPSSRFRPDRGRCAKAPAQSGDPRLVRLLPPGVPVHLLQRPEEPNPHPSVRRARLGPVEFRDDQPARSPCGGATFRR